MVRSMAHRRRPGRSLDSMPLRATWTPMRWPHSPFRRCGTSYAMSACGRPGPKQRPRRGACLVWPPRTTGFGATLSWVLAAERPTRRGSPFASDRTCIPEPGLPRSPGLGPVSSPPSQPSRAPSRARPGTDRAGRRRPDGAASPRGAGPGRRPGTRSGTSGGRRLRYSEAGLQCTPGASADQDVDDRGEQRLIGRVLRPPPCGRTFGGGISGSAVSHSPSATI